MNNNEDKLYNFLVSHHAVSFYDFIIKYRSKLRINVDNINNLYADDNGTICRNSQKRKIFTRCHYSRVYWKYILTGSIDEEKYLVRYNYQYDKYILESYKKINNKKIHVTPKTFINNIYDKLTKNKLVSYTIIPDHEFNMYISDGTYYLLQSWIYKYTLRITNFKNKQLFDKYVSLLHELIYTGYTYNNTKHSNIEPYKYRIPEYLKLYYKLFMCHKHSVISYNGNYLISVAHDNEYVFDNSKGKKVFITVEDTINDINIKKHGTAKYGRNIFNINNEYNDYLLFDTLNLIINSNSHTYDNVEAKNIIEKKYVVTYGDSQKISLHLFKFIYDNKIGDIHIIYYIIKNNIYLIKTTQNIYDIIIDGLDGKNDMTCDILKMYLVMYVVGIDKNNFGQAYMEMSDIGVKQIVFVEEIIKNGLHKHNNMGDIDILLSNIVQIISGTQKYGSEHDVYMYLSKIGLHDYIKKIIDMMDIINIGYFYELLLNRICYKSPNSVYIMQGLYFCLMLNNNTGSDIYTYMLELLKVDIRTESLFFDDRYIEDKLTYYKKISNI